MFTNQGLLCAEFPAGTEHHLVMEGTFHGTVGIGTADYTATESYYANPEGTWSNPDCTGPYAVPGTMTIEFGPLLEPPVWSCSGTGAFERRLTSVYTLEFEGPCDGDGQTDVDTQVTFTGAMEPCDPIVGCPVVHPDGTTEIADALMEGAYDQSG